jgi:hypothetical protein
MVRSLPFLSLALITLTLSACAAQPHWTQAGVSDQQTASDWADCQDFADRRTGYRADDSSSPLRIVDSRAAAKRYDQTLDACMRGKGFFPTKGR